jgi:2-methylcitrate dehydratase PrpD
MPVAHQSSGDRTIAWQLADFATALRIDSIPQEVVRKVRLHILDQIGAQLAGAGRPSITILRNYAFGQAAEGSCTVVGASGRLAAEWAGFVNAAAATAYECDDYHPAALIHPSSVAFPAALAVSEDIGAEPERLLVALVAGFEILCRIGAATQPGMNHGRGVHPTSAVGVFGAAVVAGLLRNLTTVQLASALGIAGSHACGTLEYSQSGGEVKRMHAGLAVMAGIRSAALAQAGIDGPLTIFEGSKGFLQAFTDKADLDSITCGLGSEWMLLGTAIKPYFTNGMFQPAIACVRALMDDGLCADQIEQLDIGTNRMAMALCQGSGTRPSDMVTAQFSLPYTVGMTLVMGGNYASHYAEAERCGFAVPAVEAVAGRVRVVLDEDVDREFPARFAARVSVRCRDGSVLEIERYAPGTPDNPLPEEIVREKFHSAAAESLGRKAALRVESAVDRLGSSALEELIAPLRSGALN